MPQEHAMKSRFKSILKTTTRLGGCFARNESGTFVTIFGVSFFAVMLSIGIAFDYSQISRARTIVNHSLDAAILAAGNEMLETNPNDAGLRAVFDDHLQANLASHPELMDLVSVSNFKVDRATGQIDASINTPIQTAFMAIAGYDTVQVKSFSQANFSTSPVEISMVLDVTGSMNDDGKLGSMKLAAADAIDALLPSGKANANVRIGLVPYSAGVRLSKPLALAASGQGTYTCMTERTVNPHNDVSFSAEYVGSDHRANCSGSKISPLTSNGLSLKNQIKGFSASGYTAGHLGIAWGYYMLSQKWQALWPTGSKPANYDTKTRKVAILMTDGEFNTYFAGVPNSQDPYGIRQNESNTDALELCKDMKKSKGSADGITIYTIAFAAPAQAKNTLQKCASPDVGNVKHYYDATDETELRQAFRDIANSIKKLRLTK
jgi:Flp pilus assembly protein TadG